MSRSTKRAKGQSYYFEKVNQSAAAKYVVACGACGHEGFSPSVVESEPNQVIVRELHHRYSPINLNEAGLCENCQSVSRSNSDR